MIGHCTRMLCSAACLLRALNALMHRLAAHRQFHQPHIVCIAWMAASLPDFCPAQSS